MKARNLFAALLFAALPATAAVPADQTVDVVEFYNATLDHYFMTADPKEASDLDTGVHAGWARTGLSFPAIKAGANVAGSSAICRFYGDPKAKLDSHFYTSSPEECAAVQAKFADSWLLESTEVFRAFAVDPNTGKCQADSQPVYRLYNKRQDVNHRYTTQMTVYQAMVAKGYVAEGNGNPSLPVIFCMPVKDTTIAPAGTPNCTLAASSGTPAVGSAITLTATCTNTPTTYSWTNCVSTTNTCTASSTAGGVTTYSVSGANATGTGNTAKSDVTWMSSGGAVPICTISASTSNPTAGNGVTLTANCSQNPVRYDWMTCNYMLQSACNFITSCSNTSATCSTNQSFTGLAHYALEATNTAGKGLRAGIDIDWGGTNVNNPPPTQSQPVCTVTAANTNPTVGTSVILTASCSGNPTTYAWTNCQASGPSCNASSAKAGTVSYSVVGSNTLGNGAPASVQLNWKTPAPPVCTVSASNLSPMTGTTITLNASCSGSPTNFTWTNCASSTSSCSDTGRANGPKTYSVTGTNSFGTGAAGSVTVNWQPRPTLPPVCTVTASNSAPFTGVNVTLTANCTNAPTSYKWTNCASTSSTCSTTSGSAGIQTYSVAATNVVGTSLDAGVSVNWQQSINPPDLCSAYSDVSRVVEGWGSGSPIYPKDYGGSFRAKGVIVVGVTVPGSPSSYGSSTFSASVAEYQGAPTYRQVSLSRSPCDFRAVDKTGQSGPVAMGYGNTASVNAAVGANSGAMLPGQTWYINVRNWSPTIGITCSGTCNALVGFQWPR